MPIAKNAGKGIGLPVLTLLLALATLLASHTLVDATESRRIALVIGNNQYTNLPILSKAVNDARAVGKTFREMQFDLVLNAADVDRKSFNREIADFTDEIREGDTVVFYFAGHGVAYEGTNYLLPSDFPDVESIKKLSTVETEARSSDSIIKAFRESGASQVLMILDACRDFPFPDTLTRGATTPVGLGVQATPNGVFVLFSAGIRQEALDALSEDDPDANSVFTRKLIPLLKTPGISLARMAKTLQIEVGDLALSVGHAQDPAYYDQIRGDVYLNREASEEPVNPGSNEADAAIQKMFLYEERLGQSSPIAVPGTVTWGATTGKADASGKVVSVIEAKLNVPERNIKALISMKRNTDTSIPASHLFEIVFDLPKDSVGGNIESVQRFALKQTEQDRGNALIAVSAKVTDDFHIIALNDDADARKVNMELLKTRSWIDIPVTYRNGGRALITLEKGATGKAVFDKVLGQWATEDVASLGDPDQGKDITVTPVPAASYVIQIASKPSEVEAQKVFAELSKRFATVIGGRGVDIKRVDLKNNRTFYRVRIPAGTREEAADLCTRYKAAGGSCLISK